MKTLMNKLSIYFFIVFAAFAIASCAGEDGEPGPEGPQGPIGPTGSTGATGPAGQDGADGADGQDADVTQYNYPAFDHAGTNVTFTIPRTAEELDESIVFAYAETSGNWYAIPGWVLGAHEYRVYIQGSNYVMVRVSGTGTQSFTAFRIIVIPATNVTNGRTDGIDFNNYQEVAKYYGFDL